MNILAILTWIARHWKTAINAICVASVASLLVYGCSTHRQNKKLSQELEMAQNNIEAYLGLLDSSLLANNVLRLDINNLKYEKDAALHRVDSIRKKLNIKPKSVQMAATQTLTLNVNDSKGVRGDAISIKDSIYSDSIEYNNYTKVYYTITSDTVSIALDIRNDLYLYVYETKEYKNKKSFIKRLFTLDFKKVKKTKYIPYNTNDLIKQSDIRVIEAK